MLGEEELKELGVSFGGRMILRKLIEELKWYDFVILVCLNIIIAFVFGVVIFIIYTASVVSELLVFFMITASVVLGFKLGMSF